MSNGAQNGWNIQPNESIAERPSTALKLLLIAVFILTAIPRFRFVLAGIPIYLLDVFLVLAYVNSARLSVPYNKGNRLLNSLILFVLGGICLGQLNNMLTSASMKEALFMWIRYVVVISAFFTIQKVIRSERDFQWIVRAAVLGLLVTSFISAGVSLPPTRQLTKSTVLANPYLNPDSESVIRHLNAKSSESGIRGESLIGTSTLTGAFVSVLWPLSLILIGPRSNNLNWRMIGAFSAILAPFGAILTYSRGAIAGFAGAVSGLLFLGRGRSRYQSLGTLVFLLVVIASVGVESDMFFFDRVTRMTSSFLDGLTTGDFESLNDQGRKLSYIEPFIHLANEPMSFIVGAGNTRGHVVSTDTVQFARHSTIGSAHYYFGFATAIAYTAFLITTIGLTYISGRDVNAPRADIDRILLACLVAMTSWWLLGHAAISIPRGMALVMLITGLVATNQSLSSWRYGQSHGDLS